MFNLALQTFTGWIVGAFTAGTLDAIFNTRSINRNSKAMGTLAALLQLTTGVMIMSQIALRSTNRLGIDLDVGAWYGWGGTTALAVCSFQAVDVLTNNYKLFHAFLYGSTFSGRDGLGGGDDDPIIPELPEGGDNIPIVNGNNNGGIVYGLHNNY